MKKEFTFNLGDAVTRTGLRTLHPAVLLCIEAFEREILSSNRCSGCDWPVLDNTLHVCYAAERKRG